MDAFDEMRRVIEDRHGYARRWQQRGDRVLGYLCTYTPEELIYAVGALPVRILGSHEPEDITAPYLYGMFCPFCRDCLAQGLRGKYAYLDGIVHGYCCIHIRQTYDTWIRHLSPGFSYLLYVVDHLESPAATGHLTKQMAAFRDALEKWLGTPITDAALSEAIEVYNQNRRLLWQLYQFQKEGPPRLKGSQLLEAVLSGQLMDKREHNQLLLRAVEEARQLRVDGSPVRLMLIASEVDDVEFVRFIESMDATIVVDDNCVGTRYFAGEVEPDGDRLEALARRYARAKPLCPVKDISTRERKRPSHVAGLAQEYRAQGAIFAKNKFCDPHEYDIPAVSAALRERGIPSLVLESDLLNPLGQFRTRIEAFLEMLRAEMV